MAKPEITGPFPVRPGFASPNHAVPYYRWVPPGPFSAYVPLPEAPWGSMTVGPRSKGRAYASPPESGCPSCMRGVEDDFNTSLRYLALGAAVIVFAVFATRAGNRSRSPAKTAPYASNRRPKARKVFGSNR